MNIFNEIQDGHTGCLGWVVMESLISLSIQVLLVIFGKWTYFHLWHIDSASFHQISAPGLIRNVWKFCWHFVNISQSQRQSLKVGSKVFWPFNFFGSAWCMPMAQTDLFWNICLIHNILWEGKLSLCTIFTAEKTRKKKNWQRKLSFNM